MGYDFAYVPVGSSEEFAPNEPVYELDGVVYVLDVSEAEGVAE